MGELVEVHFNCTIQELKREFATNTTNLGNDFNCTIQELKPDARNGIIFMIGEFQLHHTGIKTKRAKR